VDTASTSKHQGIAAPLSCVSISIRGIYEQRSRRDRDNDDADGNTAVQFVIAVS
jgi:hypothetical protein